MQLGQRRLLRFHRQVGEPRAEVRLAGGVAQHVGAVRADRASLPVERALLLAAQGALVVAEVAVELLHPLREGSQWVWAGGW